MRQERGNGNRTQQGLLTVPAHRCVTLDNSLGLSEPCPSSAAGKLMPQLALTLLS